MKKALKILFVLILLTVLLYGIYVIRNYMIIKKIAGLNAGTNNYSITMKSTGKNPETGEETSTIVERNYKDGVTLEKVKDSSGSVVLINWYDSNTGEGVQLYPAMQYSNTNIDESDLFSMIKPYKDFSFKVKEAMGAIITSEKVGEEDCYCIGYLVNFKMGEKTYISKNSGAIVKHVNGDTTQEYLAFSVNNLVDEDVAKPDLSKYSGR